MTSTLRLWDAVQTMMQRMPSPAHQSQLMMRLGAKFPLGRIDASSVSRQTVSSLQSHAAMKSWVRGAILNPPVQQNDGHP